MYACISTTAGLLLSPPFHLLHLFLSPSFHLFTRDFTLFTRPPCLFLCMRALPRLPGFCSRLLFTYFTLPFHPLFTFSPETLHFSPGHPLLTSPFPFHPLFTFSPETLHFSPAHPACFCVCVHFHDCPASALTPFSPSSPFPHVHLSPATLHFSPAHPACREGAS